MTEKQVTPKISRNLERARALETRRSSLSRRLVRWKERLRRHQDARLTVGLGFFVALIVLAAWPGLRLEIPVVAVFFAVFPWLVVRTRRIHRHIQRIERLLSFLGRQEQRCLGRPSGREWEEALKASAELPMARDIGLVGAHSLWTQIDETLTDGGQLQLLTWMSETPRSVEEIQARQSQVKRLRSEAWFYTRLTLEANAAEFRLSSSQILEFIKHPLTGPKLNLVVLGNWIAWITLFTLIILSYTMGWGLSAGLFIGIYALVSYFSLSNQATGYTKGIGLAHHLSELAPIFAAIEARTQRSEKLRELCPTIYSQGPSKGARGLDRVLSFMGTQTNPILHLVLNALIPWTLTCAFFLERQRNRIAATFPACLGELSELEALGTLVLLDRYQTHSYPTLTSTLERPPFKIQGAFHPLIDRSRVVANDFEFNNGKSLGLLTGSNMSGKSTFLRTVGINQLLANMGAPVFAESFSTSPLRVDTCIEVSDSLRDGFSYFYAEVRRLKAILEDAEAGRPVLYLIDEIFRGTNNRERQTGSRAVIRTLAQTPRAIGFVSTHDLELTTLESSYPSVVNLHFREDITTTGEMLFSYQLKPGPCPTTNALKIMADAGIDLSNL